MTAAEFRQKVREEVVEAVPILMISLSMFGGFGLFIICLAVALRIAP